MLDLFLSAAVNTAQIQLVAQAQASKVYLPISTKQSASPKCVTYTATNSTGRQVSDVQVNRRNSQGKIYPDYLASSLASGKTTSFDMCDSSCETVEAKQ
jgi:hypothetical protein